MRLFRRLILLLSGRKFLHRRREPRLRVLPLHSIIFTRQLAGEDVQIPVGNISTQGIGLIWFGEFLRSGAQIEGRLSIGEKAYSITLEVRHRSTELLGCRFKNPPRELAGDIRSFLKIELEAIKMSKDPASQVKQDERGHAHQYSGAGQSQIYFVLNDAKIAYFYVTFLGLYVDGTDAEHLRTARVTGINRNQLGKNISHWLDIDASLSAETMKLAWRLVDGAEKIPHDHREEIHKVLEPRLNQLLAEE